MIWGKGVIPFPFNNIKPEKVDQVIKDRTTLILETENLGLSPGRQDHSLEMGIAPPNLLLQQIAPSDAASWDIS